MSGIFLTNRIDIVEAMRPFLFRIDIDQQLGEPLTHTTGDRWIVETNRFACFNRNKIKYVYVEPHLRGHGLGKELIEQMECEIFKSYLTARLVCKKSLLPFYEKQGYETEKQFTNWLNLKKCKPTT